MMSLNDPRWGRGDGNGGNGDRQRSNDSKRPQNGKGGDGPPDLDEMWREFNRRLSRFFGRDLQTATLRMVIYLAVISAAVATVAVLA